MLTNDEQVGNNNYIFKWAVKNKQDIIETATKWRVTPSQLILIMLDDALETYKNIELKDDAWD